MKRTLRRTWKILLTWLFVCYEIGSLLDYIFFSLLHVALAIASLAIHTVMYVLYDCIFKSVVFIITFSCYFTAYTLQFILTGVYCHWDFIWITIGKDLWFIWKSLTISLKIICCDIAPKFMVFCDLVV